MAITRNSKRKQEPIKVEQFRKTLRSRNWNKIAKLCYRNYAIQAIYNIQKKLQIVNQRDGMFRLRKNDYPYFWEIGWKHFVLWYHETQESTMTIEDLNIINRIQRQFPKALIWQNPEYLKSQKLTPHIHIIIQERNVKRLKQYIKQKI